MFAKLLKHELKANKGILMILGLVSLGSGLVGGGFIWLIRYLTINDLLMSTAASVIFNFSGLLLTGCGFGLFACIVGTTIVLFSRFYKHHFTDEGYLTFTLPATIHQHLLSSICSIIIGLVFAWVVTSVACLLFFAPFSDDVLTSGTAFLNALVNIYFYVSEEAGVTGAILQIFSVILSALYTMILVLVAITIGSLRAKKHKFLAGIGVYYGLNLITSIITGFFSLFVMTDDMMSGDTLSSNYLLFTNLSDSVVYLVLTVVGYFLMHNMIKDKLNLQ